MKSWVSLSGAAAHNTTLDAESKRPHVISCVDVEDVAIERLTITGGNASGQDSDRHGGGVYSRTSSLRMQDCCVAHNGARGNGGGVFCGGGSLRIMNTVLSGNSASQDGGGIFCDGTLSATVGNSTIVHNGASQRGGGICCLSGSLTVSDCIIWGNDLYDCSATYCCIEDPDHGEGNIHANPEFVVGPLGSYYLSCVAAGQGSHSPCIDAGSADASVFGFSTYTTRTDGAPDAGVVDMGHHYISISQLGSRVLCSLNDSWFTPGDMLAASIELENPGRELFADAYIAFVMPDGEIFSFTGEGFEAGISPWFSNIFLPSGFSFGPEVILQLQVSQGCPPGDYLYASAVTQPGSLDVISWSSVRFAVSEY